MPYDILIGRDPEDKKKFGERGKILIGKGFVKMGNYNSLSNPIYLDVARTHVVLVAGKRGSGKSYTLGSIAEQLSALPAEESKNIAPIIFDTMGIFWTMKYKNDKEKELLESWNIKPKNLPVRVIVPYGHYETYLKKGIPVDESFGVTPSELEPEDWVITFNLEMTGEVAVLMQKVVSQLKIEREEFFISDITEKIKTEKNSSQSIKNIAEGLFEAAKTWGVFIDKENKKKASRIIDLAKAEVTSVLDLSVYNAVGAFNVRGLVIGLVVRKLFTERMNARKKEETEAINKGVNYLGGISQKRDVPLIWLFIDEIHEFLPENHKTPATDALIQLLREGRQPGISLVMATQQPGALHRDAITQSDIVISHRVTSDIDLKALNNMMQSYLLSSINKYMDDLPKVKGSAIILDDNSERIYSMRIKPRLTWHGGEAPSAIRAETKI
ncbi:MAG: DUF87 domain-containing protein [Nanoarchaeota archaeon]